MTVGLLLVLATRRRTSCASPAASVGTTVSFDRHVFCRGTGSTTASPTLGDRRTGASRSAAVSTADIRLTTTAAVLEQR